MTEFLPAIWKKHKTRLYVDVCPHCGKEIVWIYDGIEYYPCDREPVLFCMHPNGKQTLIYKRRELPNCILYDPKDPRCRNSAQFKAHIQHWYTCPVLKENRRAWVKNNAKY